MLEAAYAVACAGLQADRLAGAAAAGTAIVPFRGDYFALRPEARRLCRNLIYPVPDPRFPFLGVHVNRRPRRRGLGRARTRSSRSRARGTAAAT